MTDEELAIEFEKVKKEKEAMDSMLKAMGIQDSNYKEFEQKMLKGEKFKL